MARWQLQDIPDLTGQQAIITGGNAGLGYRSALELVKKGAGVVIGCRRPDAGQEAVNRILNEVPDARIECIQLDLTDLASVSAFAKDYKAKFNRLNILINNAAVVNAPTLQHTKDGHEIHMATNHYGHFALTKRLFPLLVATPKARIVTVASTAYMKGEIRFDDMEWRMRPYDRINSYGDSKLANLLFTLELQAQLEKEGSDAVAVSAHPGLTGTERQQTSGIGGKFTSMIASPVEVGVAPQLRAATDPNVEKTAYYGPRFNLRGGPVPGKLNDMARDKHLAEQLWQFTDDIVG